MLEATSVIESIFDIAISYNGRLDEATEAMKKIIFTKDSATLFTRIGVLKPREVYTKIANEYIAFAKTLTGDAKHYVSVKELTQKLVDSQDDDSENIIVPPVIHRLEVAKEEPKKETKPEEKTDVIDIEVAKKKEGATEKIVKDTDGTTTTIINNPAQTIELKDHTIIAEKVADTKFLDKYINLRSISNNVPEEHKTTILRRLEGALHDVLENGGNTKPLFKKNKYGILKQFFIDQRTFTLYNGDRYWKFTNDGNKFDKNNASA